MIYTPLDGPKVSIIHTFHCITVAMYVCTFPKLNVTFIISCMSSYTYLVIRNYNVLIVLYFL